MYRPTTTLHLQAYYEWRGRGDSKLIFFSDNKSKLSIPFPFLLSEINNFCFHTFVTVSILDGYVV